MDRFCFDVEIFKNFFDVSFVNIATEEIKTFIIWKNQNDRKELLDFLSKRNFLVSFNGLSYDMPILRFIRDYKGRDINTDLYKISSKLVSDYHREDEQVMALRYPRYPEPFVHIDLMAMMNFFRTGMSLKQVAINLKWHTIMDSPFEFTHIVEPQDVSEIIRYNVNDCLITHALYNEKSVKEARELREAIVPEYGEKVLSAAKSKMANIFFEKRYADETGIPVKEFKEFRTERSSIKFSDVILPAINFKTSFFNSVKEELMNVTVFPSNKFKFAKKVHYNKNTYMLGVGGLHTKENPAVYRATDSQSILSMDVGSFYPAVMCEYNIKPEHLRDEFLSILREVKDERIVAKKAKNYTKAETYKILINATFGKLGFPKYWFYDPLAMLRVTVNGQLFLLMLIERMEESGIYCISGNTDGAEFLVPKNLEDKAMEIAKEWQKETRFELEFTNYKLLAKRDVNSYIALGSDGKIKTKGAFVDNIDLSRGYKYPVVPNAVNNYFLYGTPVEETIRSCKNIMDFCMSQKIGKQFEMEQIKLSGVDASKIPSYSKQMKLKFLESIGKPYLVENNIDLDSAFKQEYIARELGARKLEVEDLQKTNRFFISNTGSSLQKRSKETKRTTGLMVGEYVTILNNYEDSMRFEDFDVNISWYIKEAQDMIEIIEPKIFQQELFSGANLSAIVTSLSEETSSKLANTKTPSKPKDILEADKTKKKFPVSRNYLLVTSVNTLHTPKVVVYSLYNGQNVSLKMSKALFESKKVNVGDLLEVTRFSKKPKVYKDGEKWVEIPNEVVYYIEAFEVIKDINKFIKQNRL